MSLKKTSENMMRMSIKISVYTLLVVGMIILATRGYRFGEDVFSEKGTEDYPGTDITVTIEQGASTMEVAQMLENKGLVKRGFGYIKEHPIKSTLIGGTTVFFVGPKPFVGAWDVTSGIVKNRAKAWSFEGEEDKNKTHNIDADKNTKSV